MVHARLSLAAARVADRGVGALRTSRGERCFMDKRFGRGLTLALLALLGAGAGAGAGLRAQAAGATKAAPALSDPQVAHVAVTANTIDVGMGKLALERARGAAVRSFARTMIRDHTAVNAKAGALAARLHVTPLDNDVSASLQKSAGEARAKLSTLRGRAFDRAYIDREVSYHQGMLDAIDKVLIPSAQNAELKQLLVDVRPAIAEHLAHARQLQAQLAGGR